MTQPSPNKNILDAKRSFGTILILLIAFQLFTLLLISYLIPLFSRELNFRNSLSLRIGVISIFLVAFVAIDILFYFRRIYRLGVLVNTIPQKCVIEDFLVFSYTEDNGRRYKIYPVVRDEKTDKLYFTYGHYSLSYYNSSYTMANNTLSSAIIFRKDGSVVNIGDSAYLYIRKPVKIRLYIDKEKNIIKLNRKRVPYIHVSKEYSIASFMGFIFFEGVIEMNEVMPKHLK